MKNIFLLCISTLILTIAPTGQAGVMILPANQVLSSSPKWHNLENIYLDDGLYAVDSCSAVNADTFTAGLADPTDTLNRRISKLVLYAKARTHYPKAMLWLWPVYDGKGYRSGNLKIGTTETLFSFDITPQDSALADTTWNWDDVTDLGFRFQSRTKKVIFFANYLFAAVTYVDTVLVPQLHHFQFDPIASPETVGVAFTVNISVHDSLDNPLTSYSGSALISDQTGSISPVMIAFAGGQATASVAISDTIRNDYIVVDDGQVQDTSGLFDVANSGLHHFAVDSIGMQIKNIPFAISLSARDFFDDTVTTFTGKTDLGDGTGTLTPDSTGNFTAGTWSGSVNIAAGNMNDSIFCSYSSGKTISGCSNVFWVDDPLGVSGGKPTLPVSNVCRLDIRPNPLYRQAEFSVYTPRPGPARIIIYNMLGQKAGQKDLGSINAGTVKVNWELGSSLPQGLYFARLEVNGNNTAFRKLVILR